MSDQSAVYPIRLIETDLFPIDFISAIAERESWRKEIYRPIYHVHKWWAKRLGSVFRAILLGCLLPPDADFEHSFYQKHGFSNTIVFDPFMGSGTTIGEAHKLGCIALGRDINPVACESVRVAMGPLERRELQRAFWHLSTTVGEQLRGLYRSEDETGRPCDVLYYFWVKTAPCLHCGVEVDLFSTYIIARNANPELRPEIQVYCPCCGAVFPSLNTHDSVACPVCGFEFDPHQGPAGLNKVTCSNCDKPFVIIEAVRGANQPPHHRLYAKLILTPDQIKRYLPTTSQDLQRYQECSAILQSEMQRGAVRLPDLALADGYNTRQALGYNYRNWREFFNDRQLLALGWLQAAIAELPDASTRDAFLLIFSGILEFNNLFATYKGEGTGAVRHMFSHHILKPERMPIEANVWGTAKSSGSFTNLFNNRLARALDYREAPFEVTVNGSGKNHFSSPSLSGKIENEWPVRGEFRTHGVYLSCDSSDTTSLPDRSIDFIVTDPPFFDNVHYSELADFFFAWQRLYPRGFIQSSPSTRCDREVQDSDAGNFTNKLQAVFTECHRILKDEGLLVFTYHHARPEGWSALLTAVRGAGFSIVNAHPVKSELSVAAPKSQTTEPIQVDVVLVCRKHNRHTHEPLALADAMEEAISRAQTKLQRLASAGLKLSRNDQRVVIFSQLIALIDTTSLDIAFQALSAHNSIVEQFARTDLIALGSIQASFFD